MRTLPKPEIKSDVMMIKLPKYWEVLAMERRALPELTKQLEEINSKRRGSKQSMRKRHLD